jgi:hypothetical protein
MSERETMQEIMDQELAEAIATLKRANSALSRIFNVEEEGDDGSGVCDMCAGCPNCVEEESE